MQEKINALIGFAQKSGKIIAGNNACKAKISKIKLFILAQDCSKEVAEYYTFNCVKKNIFLIDNFCPKNELGLLIGKSPRSIIGITDYNFAQKIKEAYCTSSATNKPGVKE